MKPIIARISLFALNAVIWTWAGFRFLLDWVGRSTVVDDFNALMARLPDALGSLYATPWWVPAALATALSGYLIWLTWPRTEVGKGHENLVAQYQLLRSQVGGLLATQPIPGNQEVRTWADETTALRSEMSGGKFQFIFNQPLRCAPTIRILNPIPGKSAHVQDIKAIGFTVHFLEYDYRIPVRFFADAREHSPGHDPLEQVLGGTWLGDRFVFNEPITLLQERRQAEYRAPLVVPVKPCPPGCIVEVEYDCGPGSRGSGLADERRAIVGQGVSHLLVTDEQTIVFGNYKPSVSTMSEFL